MTYQEVLNQSYSNWKDRMKSQSRLMTCTSSGLARESSSFSILVSWTSQTWMMRGSQTFMFQSFMVLCIYMLYTLMTRKLTSFCCQEKTVDDWVVDLFVEVSIEKVTRPTLLKLNKWSLRKVVVDNLMCWLHMFRHVDLYLSYGLKLLTSNWTQKLEYLVIRSWWRKHLPLTLTKWLVTMSESCVLT